MALIKRVLTKYKEIGFARCDDTGRVFYFSVKDFPGLNCRNCSFESVRGDILQAYVYSYENPREDKLIVFDHGLGGGHTAYMKEINMLCKQGYQVFAYDHTGCMTSEGESTNGMAQSLCDLNDCLKFIKSKEEYAHKDISVVGHSWGAFAAMNISAFHPDVSKIVAISGFASVKHMVYSSMRGPLAICRKPIMEMESKANPEYVNYDASETLAETKANVLLIYSDNDHICHKKVHYDYLFKKLGHKDNIKFILESGKNHNPNYTLDAVSYKHDFFTRLEKGIKKQLLDSEDKKKAFIASYDWNRMTAQDEVIWGKIFEILG